MSKSSYRNIEVDGRNYRWKVGKSFVKISGLPAVPHNKEQPFPGTIFELDSDFERVTFAKVTPGHIAAYIKMKVEK
jgi:hypothetical protein